MAPLGFDPQSFVRKLFSIPTQVERRIAPSRGLTVRRSPRHGALSLGFETLESRQMLAADMAEIVGTVWLDVQGDGNAANDTLVAGATVELYRDGGNGVFDAGDILAGGPALTDALGQYRFTGVGVGKFFVKLTLPPALQATSGGAIKEINITAADADGAIGQTIDGFTSTQIAEAAPPLPSNNHSTQNDPSVVGGERDMYVELTDGTDAFSSVSLISAGGLLRLASDTTVTGNAKVVWDGQDGSATSINPTGLGGLDFTGFDGNTMTGIVLAVGADHPNCVVKLKIYTNGGQWTEFTATVPQSPGGAATKQLTINFNSAPSSSAGGGADFGNVGAVELTFVGVSAVDGQVSLVGLIGLTTKPANFTAYNRLTLGDRVWSDADNDGQLDAGEQGISGVKLNLYNDIDGNNQYTGGVDALVGSTTTNGTGHYQFTDLLPGAYVVQVDALSFHTGQALAGLKSSTGSAADPDNNVDNDDNGSPLAGLGVVSQAISLTASNNTVDFGFFGFDLVLDKAVEQTAVSPLETVTYTVRVINDGPSTALGVQFMDTLPAGVTFQSLSVSKPGITLQHNAGIITGSLGDMADGEVVVVTILATVKASAIGVLRNEAEVSAPNEDYTLNNRDEVETPITPKFDLVLDKSVEQTTVSPLETVTYTVRIVNDGPSVANSVQFVDNLPAGVTFQSLSVSKPGITLQHNAGVITGSLGNMANGDVVIVTILTTVKASAAGTLRNEAEVSALNEDYTLNNYDEVETPITPKIDLAIDKIDSKDPVSANEQFSYTVTVTNNGPSNATGVTVVDTLPASGVTFVGASIAPTSVAGRDLTFDLGNLASGASRTFTITVQVNQGFSGTLLNYVEVSGDEPETDYTNNEDTEPTVVKVDPASIGGYVYVDKDKDGNRDAGEKPIPNVVLTLTGTDYTGGAVTRTTVTDANGAYSFLSLMPGMYHVKESHPIAYKDGIDTLGNTFNALGQMLTTPNGQPGLDSFPNDAFDADSFQQVSLESGFAALDYNFGELAVTTSKADFIRHASW